MGPIDEYSYHPMDVSVPHMSVEAGTLPVSSPLLHSPAAEGVEASKLVGVEESIEKVDPSALAHVAQTDENDDEHIWRSPLPPRAAPLQNHENLPEVRLFSNALQTLLNPSQSSLA